MQQFFKFYIKFWDILYICSEGRGCTGVVRQNTIDRPREQRKIGVGVGVWGEGRRRRCRPLILGDLQLAIKVKSFGEIRAEEEEKRVFIPAVKRLTLRKRTSAAFRPRRASSTVLCPGDERRLFPIFFLFFFSLRFAAPFGSIIINHRYWTKRKENLEILLVEIYFKFCFTGVTKYINVAYTYIVYCMLQIVNLVIHVYCPVR